MAQPGQVSRTTSKEAARSGLDRSQIAMGLLLVLSGAAGSYLLLTDGSLWRLALSHAVGLVVIVLVDFAVGFLSLLSVRSVYLPSQAAVVLGVVLQLGDIVTAPQYNMTVQYFAAYLFGLWAFDLLLGLQIAVLVVGLAGRRHAVYLSRRKSRRGKELDYSKRGFVKSIGVFGSLVGFAAVLSSIKLPVPTSLTQTTTTSGGTPRGAVANVNDMKPGTPVYFQYPAGYPSMLLMLSDGTLSAVSLLCTHVCCECEYLASDDLIACPCHGSVFDTSGNVLQGPALTGLPKVTLQTDQNGYVYPTGVDKAGPCQV